MTQPTTNGQAAPAAPPTEVFKVEGVDMALTKDQQRERIQKSLAVDKRLEEVSRMRNELQAREQTMGREVQFAQYFNTKLAQDPAGLRAELDRMIRLAEGDGGSTAAAATNSDGTDPAPGSHRDPALLREFQELKEKVRQVATDSSVDRLTRDISSALNQRPIFNDPNNPASNEARELAEFLVRSLRATQQGAGMAISDLVSQAEARVVKLMSAGTQATFDSRVATANAVPAVHAESGTPAIGADDFKASVKSFKDEGPQGMRAKLNALAQRIAPTR